MRSFLTPLFFRAFPRPFCREQSSSAPRERNDTEQQYDHELKDDVRKYQSERRLADVREKRRVHEKEKDKRWPDVFQIPWRWSEHRTGVKRE